jgi:hypothetical protein
MIHIFKTVQTVSTGSSKYDNPLILLFLEVDLKDLNVCIFTVRSVTTYPYTPTSL